MKQAQKANSPAIIIQTPKENVKPAVNNSSVAKSQLLKEPLVVETFSPVKVNKAEAILEAFKEVKSDRLTNPKHPRPNPVGLDFENGETILNSCNEMHQDIQNMHIDMLRQFQVQKVN